MRIKKHKNGNEYLLTSGGVWVRNFTKHARPIDINSFTTPTDRKQIIANQLHNTSLGLMHIGTEKKTHFNVAIISDGYDFKNIQPILKTLPKDVIVIGVNKTLSKWEVPSGRPMNYYVVNNPYQECTRYLPQTHRYYPTCIASTKTSPEFLQRYLG